MRARFDDLVSAYARLSDVRARLVHLGEVDVEKLVAEAMRRCRERLADEEKAEGR